jgi:hypothetical protein
MSAGTVSQWLEKYAQPKGPRFIRARELEGSRSYTVIGFSVFRRGRVESPVLLLKQEEDDDDNLGLVLHAPQMRNLEKLGIVDLTDLQGATIILTGREIPGFGGKPVKSIEISNFRRAQ